MTVNDGDELAVSVITCPHDEEKYVGKCLSSVRGVLKGIKSEIIFGVDMCTDDTVKTVKKFNVTSIIEKNRKNSQKTCREIQKKKSLEEDC